MNEKCIRCRNKNVVIHISSEGFPLCEDCAKEWMIIIHDNAKKFDALKENKFHNFWNLLWEKFTQKEVVQFT